MKLDRARTLATVELGKVAGGDDIQAEKKQERAKRTMPTLKAVCCRRIWRLDTGTSSLGKSPRLHRLQEVLPWQDRPAGQISVKMVENWQTKRARDGIAPATIERDLATLHSLFSKAAAWGYLETHPMTSLQRIQRPDNGVVRYLDSREEKRLLSALRSKQTPDYLCIIVIVAMNTGLRRGELLKSGLVIGGSAQAHPDGDGKDRQEQQGAPCPIE